MAYALLDAARIDMKYRTYEPCSGAIETKAESHSEQACGGSLSSVEGRISRSLGVRSVRAFGAGTLVLVLSSGCGESVANDTPQNGGVGGDNVSVAGAKSSAGAGGVTSTSTAGGSSGVGGEVTYDVISAGAGNVVHELGFEIRTPRAHTMDCAYNRDPTNPLLGDVPETDWLCTFKHAGVSGHVYVQSTPVACHYMMGVLTGEYESRGWLELDGTVSELSNVDYTWGGVHHVDSLSFELNNRKYTYGHSTMMYGRPCQLVDCISVSTLDGTLIENGCTEERTLPVTCVPIAADGTHRDLTDHYVTCDHATLCKSTGGTVEKTRYQCGNFSNTCNMPLDKCEFEPNGNEYSYCHCPEGTCFEPLGYEAFQWKGCVAIEAKK